jgi:hypothetical protein
MPAPLRLQSAPPLSPQSPPCPNCGSQMRLDRIEPSHYINLHLWCYACGCGGESHNYVADRTRARPPQLPA